ncbi:Uncharacterized protein CK203_048367 [Vitis vinifera]|uniref:AMMECR1 domain-containing protein n=1 Tax=Vitis vinifera TaxID=29760 RepID=A0A438HRH1_VITVI|nr:Uncharacterized protein CK203_048367 [Vitis vinifera]
MHPTPWKIRKRLLKEDPSRRWAASLFYNRKTKANSSTSATPTLKELLFVVTRTCAMKDGTLMTNPLFVTWKKVVNGGEPRLRGCIGTLEARCLINGFKDYALTRYYCNTYARHLFTYSMSCCGLNLSLPPHLSLRQIAYPLRI